MFCRLCVSCLTAQDRLVPRVVRLACGAACALAPLHTQSALPACFQQPYTEFAAFLLCMEYHSLHPHIVTGYRLWMSSAEELPGFLRCKASIY